MIRSKKRVKWKIDKQTWDTVIKELNRGYLDFIKLCENNESIYIGLGRGKRLDVKKVERQ